MKKIITIILISLSIVLVGCTSTTKSDAGSNKLEVSFDADKGCSEKSYEAKSGTLEITGKNTGKDVGELEVLDGDRISGEAENIISGASKTFTVKLEEGDYEFFCGRKQAKRSTLKIVKNADS
jgi:iron uptake system EfeUOB component EfeO/EfeM